jgi:hypothetical protein
MRTGTCSGRKENSIWILIDYKTTLRKPYLTVCLWHTAGCTLKVGAKVACILTLRGVTALNLQCSTSHFMTINADKMSGSATCDKLGTRKPDTVHEVKDVTVCRGMALRQAVNVTSPPSTRSIAAVTQRETRWRTPKRRSVYCGRPVLCVCIREGVCLFKPFQKFLKRQ